MSTKKTPLSLVSYIQKINKLSSDSSLFSLEQQSILLDAIDSMLNVVTQATIDYNRKNHETV